MFGEDFMAYILLADDEPASVNLAADWLAKDGHQVRVVTDGRQALELVRAEVPDFLVTDVMMPFADGFEVIRELCARYPEKRVPIVLLSNLGADGQPMRIDHLDYPIVSYLICRRSVEQLARQIVEAIKRNL
jgi:CheY-like chemotaxis protein